MRNINRPLSRLGRLFALVGMAALVAALLGPSVAYAQPPVYRFIPELLVCEVTEDNRGVDDTYMRADGRVYWPHNGVEKMVYGSSYAFDATYTRLFIVDLKLDLWDHDRGIWDDDDFLGTAWIDASMAGLGQIRRDFTGDGADYRLFFRVERVVS